MRQILQSAFRIHLYFQQNANTDAAWDHFPAPTLISIHTVHSFNCLTDSLACFRQSPGALAAGRAVPSDEAGGNAAEAAGLGDGGPRSEAVGAV